MMSERDAAWEELRASVMWGHEVVETIHAILPNISALDPAPDELFASSRAAYEWQKAALANIKKLEG